MTTRSLQDIDQDIVSINETLACVTETRASLDRFTTLVQSESKGPNFVATFKQSVKDIDDNIARIETFRKRLELVFDYARQVAEANAFDWALIKEFVQKDKPLETEEGDDTAAQEGPRTDDTSLGIQSKAEHVLQQLYTVILDRRPGESHHKDFPDASKKSLLTESMEQWMNRDKTLQSHINLTFERKEQETMSGSVMRIKVVTQNILAVTLDIEFDRSSDSINILWYDIKGLREKDEHSHHIVFRRIESLAADALRDMSELTAKEALYSILQWIASFHQLFSVPCHRCHKILEFDSPQNKFLPPLVRTWVRRAVSAGDTDDGKESMYSNIGTPYHLRCFRMTL